MNCRSAPACDDSDVWSVFAGSIKVFVSAGIRRSAILEPAGIADCTNLAIQPEIGFSEYPKPGTQTDQCDTDRAISTGLRGPYSLREPSCARQRILDARDFTLRGLTPRSSETTRFGLEKLEQKRRTDQLGQIGVDFERLMSPVHRCHFRRVRIGAPRDRCLATKRTAPQCGRYTCSVRSNGSLRRLVRSFRNWQFAAARFAASRKTRLARRHSLPALEITKSRAG